VTPFDVDDAEVKAVAYVVSDSEPGEIGALKQQHWPQLAEVEAVELNAKILKL